METTVAVTAEETIKRLRGVVIDESPSRYICFEVRSDEASRYTLG